MPSLDANISAFLSSTGAKLVGNGFAKFDEYSLLFVRFTPTAAKNVLRHFNSHNRNRRDSRVLEYAKAVVAKEWQLNGAMIVLDPNGQLLDGQHRLEAISTAKKSVIFPIMFGVPFAAFKSIDRGGARTLADDLYTLDYPWPHDRAKLTKLIYRDLVGNITGLVNKEDGLNPSVDMGLDIAHYDIDSREKLTRGLNFVYGYPQWSCRKLLSRAEAAWCWLKLEEINRAGATEYMHRVITGEAPSGGASTGVAVSVRNRLLEIATNPHNGQDRKALRVLTIMVGWNRYCSNGNDSIRKFDVPKLRDKHSRDLLQTELPTLKKPNRRITTLSARWFAEDYSLDATLTSGERRGEKSLERARNRMLAVDERSVRLHDTLTEEDEDDEE